jgi:hypothetical protein
MSIELAVIGEIMLAAWNSFEINRIVAHQTADKAASNL